MSRRTVLTAVALVIALLGTSAVFAYVRGVDKRAIRDQDPVEALVAKEDIPAGTSGQEASSKGLLRLAVLPRKAVPEGALSTIAPVRDLVTLTDVFKGEILLQAKFSEQQAATGALVIPGDKIAVSVELGDPQRVAGFVVPGSDVAIFVTLDVTRPGTTGQGAQSAAIEQRTQLLLQRVKVIAVGPATLRKVEAKNDDTSDREDEPTPAAVLTVAVTQAEGEKLVHAANTGKLYFGLLSGQSATGPTQGVDDSTLFR